jgi:hypothetical protein
MFPAQHEVAAAGYHVFYRQRLTSSRRIGLLMLDPATNVQPHDHPCGS